MSDASAGKPLIGLTCRWDEEKRWYYLPSDYARAVAEAGGLPVMIPLVPGAVAALAERLDGFVLTGSSSDVDPARYGQQRQAEVTRVHDERDETDVQVFDQAFREHKPVLGICYGMQALNVYLGGTLLQHIPATVTAGLDHENSGTTHPVVLEHGSQIAEWANGTQIRVNSTHHQAVDRPGRGLRVAARAPDGVIEAVEGGFPGQFVMGVQWHPERIWQKEPVSAQLFAALVRAATERHAPVVTT